jgi:hypothetical protein
MPPGHARNGIVNRRDGHSVLLGQLLQGDPLGGVGFPGLLDLELGQFCLGALLSAKHARRSQHILDSLDAPQFGPGMLESSLDDQAR